MFRHIAAQLVVIASLTGMSIDTCAAVIESGETWTGSLIGGPGGNGREESWTFTGAANDQIVIATALQVGSIQPEIYLYEPGGITPIASAIGSFSSQFLNCRLLVNGTFTITVRDYGLNGDGSYSISFANMSGPAVSASDGDGGTIVSNQTVTGSFYRAADTDLFQFTGAVGDRVIISTSGSGTQPEIYLFPPGGEALEQSHQGGLNPRRLDWRLLASGTYTILLCDSGLNAEGSYTISFVKMSGPGTPVADANAEIILSGETKVGQLSPPVDVGLYQFAVQRGDHVIITAAGYPGGVLPELYLFPPDGQPLEASLVGGVSGRVFEWDPQFDGTYTVVLSDYGLNTEGPYSISLATIPGSATSAGDADGGAIASGETKLGHLSSRSDTDIYQFPGQAGDLVIITTAENTGNVQPEIRLHAPNGAIEAQALGGKDSQWLEHRLLADGQYSVVVNDNGLDAEGWYAVSLAKFPGTVTSSADPDGGIIMSGGAKAGMISYQADTDLFQFHGTAGTRVIVTTSSTTIEPETRLYSPTGALERFSSPLTRTGRDDWQLLETGLYTLVVNDAGLNLSGSYYLSLVQLPGGVSPSNDRSDSDGGVIANAESKVGAFHFPPDQDVYHFYGRPGDTVAITAAPYAYASVQPQIHLYPPGGGALEDWATGSLMPQKLTHTLLKKGLYTVVVSDLNLDSTGYYSVAFSTSAATPVAGIYNIFPPHGTSVVATETRFRWDRVAGATGYEFYYGTDPLQPLNVLGTVATNSRIFPERVAGKTYYWRVIALTPAGRVSGPFTWFKFMRRPVIHRDDFTDGNDTGDPNWLPYRYASWRVNETKQLVSTVNVDNRIINNNFSSFLTGKIQALTMLSGSSSTANASLLFSYQGDHQRYRYVKLQSGKILIGQAGYLGGQSGGIKKTILVPTVLKKWYKLRADLDSLGNVKIYLDGSLKGSFKFTKAVAGWLGFGADRVESLFDNFYCEEATVFP